jgi:hypothetical protein
VYHSWPNIRAEPFGAQQPNNELVFAWENKPDGTPDWKTVSIPTGSYQIEQINNEFQRRIKSLTGKESKIAITVHEPTLSSSIEISTPGYRVDIYNSSIRTVLGWPKNPPHGDAHTDAQSYHDVVVKYRSDWDIIKTAKSRKLFRFRDRDTMQWYFQYANSPDSLATVTTRLSDITDAFNEINENFKIQLEQLKKNKRAKTR